MMEEFELTPAEIEKVSWAYQCFLSAHKDECDIDEAVKCIVRGGAEAQAKKLVGYIKAHSFSSGRGLNLMQRIPIKIWEYLLKAVEK